MNALELSRALGGVDEKLVEDAAPEGRVYDKERITRPVRIWRIAAPVALLVAIAITLHFVLPRRAGEQPVPGPVNKAYALEIAEYPEMPNIGRLYAELEALDREYREGKIPEAEFEKRVEALQAEFDQIAEANEAYQMRVSSMRGAGKGLEGFFADSAADALMGSDGENRVYSPLNTYLALAMLAEVTGGESRAQILNLLDEDSIDALRTRANHIWNANYRDDGSSICLPASSIWLNEDIPLNGDTLKTLARHYYSSSFQGKMGSRGYLDCLRGWISETCGGLLDEQSAGMQMDPEDAIILLCALRYQARWADEFDPEKNEPGVFHSPHGDVPAEYMVRQLQGLYYYAEHFAAISVPMLDRGAMWFLLPDEGVDMDALLSDREYRQFIRLIQERRLSEEWKKQKFVRINLRLPKFDVSSDTDLRSILQALGVTDCFDPERADLTPLLAKGGLWIDRVDCSARLIVDEQGVRAASLAAFHGAGAAPPPDDEVDFFLDRPFTFLLVSADDVPLYTGVVNQPQ